jgi:hypothetical protein
MLDQWAPTASALEDAVEHTVGNGVIRRKCSEALYNTITRSPIGSWTSKPVFLSSNRTSFILPSVID